MNFYINSTEFQKSKYLSLKIFWKIEKKRLEGRELCLANGFIITTVLDKRNKPELYNQRY